MKLREVMADFSFALDAEKVKKICRAQDEDTFLIEKFCEAAQAIARPKVALVVAPFSIAAGVVTIEGVEIPFPWVAEKLASSRLPFVCIYTATCGLEIEEWSQSLDDVVEQFYADEIKKNLLGAALAHLTSCINHRFFKDEKISSLNPGSLLHWPIEGQRSLFQILGETAVEARVSLTDSCLMLPSKSVSGMFFQDDTGHINCALCPREKCPNRRTPFVR